MQKQLLFIFQMISLGLVMALGLVFIFPQKFGPQQHHLTNNAQTAPASRTDNNFGKVSFANAVAKAAPAVVSIHSKKFVIRETLPSDPYIGSPDYYQERETVNGLGSGVIFNDQGYILTSNHVIADADNIRVQLNDSTIFTARAIGADPETDLAVLKIETSNLPVIPIGNSAEIKVGDVVLAIGYPYQIGQTVTQGIISATGRNQLGQNTFEDFIQTDAAINRGNSGGALIDSQGRLIGINAAIDDMAEGIGFAIPINLARKVMTQIIQHGQVVRGWLGVQGESMFSIKGNFRGVRLTQVFADGPAETAGLMKNDILIEINGQNITGVRAVLNQIAQSSPGDTLEITGYRNRQPFKTTATVSVRPLNVSNNK